MNLRESAAPGPGSDKSYHNRYHKVRIAAHLQKRNHGNIGLNYRLASGSVFVSMTVFEMARRCGQGDHILGGYDRSI
jgi:hypothetical protein